MSSRPTKTLVGEKAQKMILEGVNAIYDPVRRTLGPEGKNALLYRTLNRGERITNDGVTVADVQEPKNEFVRMAASAFKESCKKTNEKVGDGTTSTVVIGGKLFNDIYALMSDNGGLGKTTKGIIKLTKELLNTCDKVKEAIKNSAKLIEKLEDLEKVARVSLGDKVPGDEDLAKIIAKMAWECGVDGFIDVVEGYKGEIETEVIKGMRFPAKVVAKGFLNNPKRYEMVAEDCPVFITNYALDNIAQIRKCFEPLMKNNAKLAVIAPSFSDSVLKVMFDTMFVRDNHGNLVKTGVDLYPVAVPSLRTEQFEDLAVYCGAKFVDKNKGNKLENNKADNLGFLEKMIIKDTELKEDGIIVGGGGTKIGKNPALDNEIGYENEEDKTKTPIEERIEILKGQLVETKQDIFKKLLERRIASMASAIGIIRVGDTTQASSLYRKLKIEDAVYACKSALRGGYVKGGGLCLKEIADKLPDDEILKAALLAPYEQIQETTGGIEITDDIIDPTEAVYYSVEHAVGVVAKLATVDIITPEIEDPVYGEGEFAIAKQLFEANLIQKIKEGQMKSSEVEMERDRYNGLTEYEFVQQQENS